MKNNFVISYDLKKTYNHVSVHPTMKDLLGRKKNSSFSINIGCGAVSKFIYAFITDFNFAQSRFIKKGFMTNNPKKHLYLVMWNPDLLIF
jgi:hypothetical protein